MQYFYDNNKKGVAHLWEGEDTFCQYLATTPETQMTVKGNKLTRRVCQSCKNQWIGWMSGKRRS